jgi:CheY-like chemotaxis protein
MSESAPDGPQRRGPKGSEDRPRVLLVDDEVALLDGLELQLRRHVTVVAASSPRLGLTAIEHQGPFEVVISDMRMPGMDGVAFLSRVREIDPTVVRMMLTGNNDVETALAAVNEGNVFRFLVKPCPPHILLASVEAAVEQYRLVTAERVLLSQTLAGCVRALTSVLAIARPRAMGRALRARQRVTMLASRQGRESWAVEIAAMLSQLPTVALPVDLERRYVEGEDLREDERARVDRVPAIAAELIAGIPRLEEVREILLYVGRPSLSKAPWGAKVLAAALDLDALAQGKADSRVVLARLSERNHDPWLVEALADLWLEEQEPTQALGLPVQDLNAGMVLAADVVATNGALMATAGHDITPSLLEHLRAVAVHGGVVEPVYVRPAIASGLWG